MNNPEPSRPTSDAQPRSLHEVLDVLADRIEARQNSYHLAHSGLATHVFKTLADEIRAVAKETRSTSNAPHELPPTKEREPRSGTEGAIGG